MSESQPEQPAQKADLDPEQPEGDFLTTDGGGAPFYPEHNDPERAEEFHPEVFAEREAAERESEDFGIDLADFHAPFDPEVDLAPEKTGKTFLYLDGPAWCTAFNLPREDGTTLVFDQTNGAVEVDPGEADDIIIRAEAHGITLVKVSQ